MIPSITAYYPDFEQDLLQACKGSDISSILVEAMQYSLAAGGKRVRPLLSIMTCQDLGAPIKRAYPAALALEMIHTYSLIHDDLPCMDDDDLRRGKPTNHKVYGQAHAVLAGDALLTMAFEILTRADWDLPPQNKLDIIRILASASGSSGMVGGQALDLESENKTISADTLELIHQNKTGRLITASVMTGAAVATDDLHTLESMQIFGQAIGLAFQVADDILDVTQTSETLGKDAGSDLTNNKATYPALLGLDAAKTKLENLYQSAIQALDQIKHPCKDLRTIAKFIIQRTS
ncbi:MAG: polyprenyl synthetase family protein [Deltaproteobacteria bacterium]|nr:polyprenyl synthetase family protein [Deltaproteobacteria bacterium]